MITIITVGNLKEKYLKAAEEEYLKRIKKYNNIKIIEVKEETEKEDFINLENEAKKISNYINSKDYIITLEIEGEELSSIELSKKIESINMINSNITFIIGSSNGLSNIIKEKSNYKLSFSKLTFPHQLFRILLLEQIYRSYKIINNEKYHK